MYIINVVVFFRYESNENMTITCSTKVCSFGKQVVEKVETEYARYENGRFVYRIHRSPMCEYMINFIHKLKHLPEKYMMNSVLENFTILQVLIISLFIKQKFDFPLQTRWTQMYYNIIGYWKFLFERSHFFCSLAITLISGRFSLISYFEYM